MARILIVFLTLVFCSALDAHAADSPKPGQKANRLLNEASPYLRQHAYNPIDWYPWGEEAFKKARAENKPIYLSVGYSTCHWCHVMARESFVDKDVAKLLNAYFVPVKLDRERHPDVDETYILATEIIQQRGGWPNSVFLSPDLKPFHADTYMPKDVFLDLIGRVAQQWETNNVAIIQQGDEIARVIDAVMSRRVQARSVTPELLQKASDEILKSLDVFNGGFSTAPKFPQESTLLFLADRALHRNDEKAAKALTLTLDNMLNGGIQDHVGGGFHRYAVDNEWRIPHFEKMLYNQALLSLVLTRAFELTGDERYADALRRTLEFVMRDMRGPEGAFYSAFDADSEGHEGTYYVWTPKSLKSALGADHTKFAQNVFGVSEKGNFERNTTVLHFPKSPSDMANDLKIGDEKFASKIGEIRKKLLNARDKRERPHRDDKYIVAWNGLMIAAFAEASDLLGEKRFGDVAREAATFIWDNMRGSEGGLKRIYFENKPSLDGSQTDYAYFARGLTALYDWSGDKIWLERAETLAEEMVARFEDKEAGDYYRTAGKGTFTRGKTRNDASVPSGNGVALEVFAKLAKRSGMPEHRRRAEALLNAMSGISLGGPSSNGYALMAADRYLHGVTARKQYFGKGVVQAEARYDEEPGHVVLSLAIAPGWHINANKVLDDFLVPTEATLTGAKGAEAARYPKPIIRKLGFHEDDLALFEGDVEFTLPLGEMPEDGVISAELRLQACNDEICLEPETGVLRIRVDS